MDTAIAICAGGPLRVPLPTLASPFVVAADAGAVEAHRLGLHVDVLVGDMDSVPSDVREKVAREGGEVRVFPTHKDATDLELAMDVAIEGGARRILVLGGDGGRLDHLLGNALLLASPRFARVQVDAILGGTRLSVIRGRREITGYGGVGALVSLFAMGGPARGVRTTGLRWALHGEELTPGSSRGISNEFTAESASVDVSEGVVVTVVPQGGMP